MIRVEQLSKSFRRHRVLDAVSLALGPGERVALVGANGAGKTTLIRCLLGQYRCSGVARVAGLAPRAQRTRVLRRVGFVPQLPPPLQLPVGELLRFAAALGGCEVAQLEALAHQLGLDAPAVRRQPFRKLSGGQQQKLLIAVALRPQVDVLILDEPAANLDPAARAAFFGLLAARDHAAAMLISSHRIDEVAALVHRVVELERGRVVLDERVAAGGGLDALLACRVELRRPDAAAAAALHAWGLQADAAGEAFEGRIPGADRLRFLGTLSRYAGLLRGVRVEECEG